MLHKTVIRLGLGISIASISLFVWLAAVDSEYIEERLETLTLIYRFQVRNLIRKPAVPDNIMTVLVDEQSLSEIGRWPWPRKTQAGLISGILEQSPKALAIDILYPETEDAESDAALASVFAAHPGKAVLATGFNVPRPARESEGPAAPDFVADSSFLQVKDTKLGRPPLSDRVIPPIEIIGEKTALGHVYNLKDIDGKTVWELPYVKYNDDYYPSLALQAARIAAGLPMEKMALYMGRGISLGERFVPFNPYGGKLLINYLGPELTIRSVSASDVLAGRVDRDLFRDKIVFLGTSAIATYDIITTPFSANMPGVEKNATVTENIINQRFIIKAYLSVQIAVIIITGLLFAILFSRLSALKASLYSFLAIFGYLVLVQVLFTYFGVWMNVVYPLSNMFVIFTSTTITKYFLEERKAKEIRRIFSSYVSPKIVREVIDHPEKAGLSGTKKTVTILFSDIQGFTSISERNDPEVVVSILNEYFTEMTDIIFRWDGTLDKFVGDEIMAFWGAPVDQPDHAERAVRCALDMSRRLAALQKKWAIEGKEILRAGIGINTGEVVIGNIGAEGKKMDYTAIGDHVNTAARVEKLTRQYDAKIIITEFTQRYVETLVMSSSLGHIEVKLADTVKVKGKEIGLKIYSIKDTEQEEEKQ